MRYHARHDGTGAMKSLLVTCAFAVMSGSLVVGLLNTSRLHAQSSASEPPDTPPHFEVASIKPNTSGSRRSNLDLQPGGRFIATNVPLVGLVRIAYGDDGPIPPDRLSIGTQGIERKAFDIEAKAFVDLTHNEMRVALQKLLVDRFKLMVHHEARELPMYALVLARADGRLGPRLRRSDVDCSDPQNVPAATADGTPSCGFRVFPGKATGRITMSDLARRMLINALDDRRPIEDRTGLLGTFDFDLEWTPAQPPPPRPVDAPPAPPINPDLASVFTALREQLGLKLEPWKGHVDILVIDSAEAPTEN